MIPLFENKLFEESKNSTKFPLKCKECSTTFFKRKSEILRINNEKYRLTYDFCSKKCKCNNESKKNKLDFNCPNCGKYFSKSIATTKKAVRHFCSRSCNTTFQNINKTKGFRRSKLEIWIEEQLTMLYPKLEVDYNKRNTIGSELDIYIPSLNVAFELNGIFHYEPIYGNDKLKKTIAKDISKTKACHEHKIDLCVIDVSSFGHFKLNKANFFLKIITDIINQRFKC